MSLTKNTKLIEVAKVLCRELRKNQTYAESILWEQLRDRKFHGLKYYRQYPLFFDLLGKETFYIADFYCYEKQLVIEIDGSVHKFKGTQDSRRTEIINLLGINVIRFQNHEIEKELDSVLKKLRLRIKI